MAGGGKIKKEELRTMPGARPQSNQAVLPENQARTSRAPTSFVAARLVRARPYYIIRRGAPVRTASFVGARLVRARPYQRKLKTTPTTELPRLDRSAQIAPMPVEPPTLLDPVAYAAKIQSRAQAAGFRTERYGQIAGQPLYALTRRTSGPRPRIYLSAGIHGDEPAPPLALLELIDRGVLDDRAVWFVCPLINPIGFTRQTRENAEGIDLNRDYKALRSLEVQAHARWLQFQPNFDVALCLHEDWEAQGFYLYELNPLQRPGLAARMLGAVAAACPLEVATTIDGRPVAEPGIIRPVDEPALRELWPESIYLRAHHTRLGYTLETPSSFPLPQRIAAHVAAVEAAIEVVCGPKV